eukprot:TRINITY_DN7080_c2_g1_i1.p1 TRINITY_DN7080_c2_g1~~TRINITY_DN7080_c2_g1_i1.p1  ORF type:complete len:587 (+),score=168.59 TRINITY_DN7080_c2_g1_i1:73-1761(+)
MPLSNTPPSPRQRWSAEEWRAELLRERGGTAEPARGWKVRAPKPERPRNGACNVCGEEGHWARDCKLREGAETPSESSVSPLVRERREFPPPSEVPRRGLMDMPCRGRYTCDCEHTRQALAEEAWNGPPEDLWISPATKPRGFEFYEMLGRPKYVVAPMVEQSELSYRLLCKRYGADLCYSPMINSSCFMKDPCGLFRNREFSTCPADTNMFAQLCGNDPELVVGTAKELQYSGCKAIDLNLGCPQGIAKRGNYGAFLMDDLALIRSLITALDQHIDIPITAKIRCFPDPQHTVEYARMCVDAGASIVTVHGRLREQKGHEVGCADWGKIRMVKEALDVPVFANGNIWWHGDIERCFAETGCDAVMSADSLLWDPRLFSNPQSFLLSGRHFFVEDPLIRAQGVQLALDYLDICETHPTQVSHMKTHVFKLAHQSMHAFPDMRLKLNGLSCRQDSRPMRPLYHQFCTELLEMEMQAAAEAGTAATPPPAGSVREAERMAQHCTKLVNLGNVEVPSECALSHMITRTIESDSEYRKKKDCRGQHLDDAEGAEDGAVCFADLFEE